MSMITDGELSQTQRVRDVSSIFTLTRAESCPVSTMIKKGPRPKSTLYERPYKKPFTPTNNAVLDGAEATNAEFQNNEANKFMLQGRLQKSRVAIAVSDLAQEFGEDFAAVNLMADNMKDGLQLARESLEVELIDTQDSRPQGGGGATNPALMRGASNWLRTANPANPDLPIPTELLTPSDSIVTGKAAASNISEANFAAIMQSIAETARLKGTWDVFVSPDLASVIDTWTKIGDTTSTTVPLRRFNTDMKNGEVVMEVRFYQTTFGRLRFHVHYFLPAGVHCLILNMDRMEMRPGYPIRVRELPYMGAGTRRIIEWVTGLDSDPLTAGKITT